MMDAGIKFETAVEAVFPGSKIEKRRTADGWVLALTRGDFDKTDGPKYRSQLFDGVVRQDERETIVRAASFAPDPRDHYSERAALRTFGTERSGTQSLGTVSGSDLYVKLHFVDAEALFLEPGAVPDVRAVLDPEYSSMFHPGPFEELEFAGRLFSVRFVSEPDEGTFIIHLQPTH